MPFWPEMSQLSGGTLQGKIHFISELNRKHYDAYLALCTAKKVMLKAAKPNGWKGKDRYVDKTAGRPSLEIFQNVS